MKIDGCTQRPPFILCLFGSEVLKGSGQNSGKISVKPELIKYGWPQRLDEDWNIVVGPFLVEPSTYTYADAGEILVPGLGATYVT